MHMGMKVVEGVPRYFETYVNDCFATAYGALISHAGYNPNIILAEYLSFMYDPETEYIGTNFLYRFSATVEFSEEELNTSLEFAYFPKTTYFSDPEDTGKINRRKDMINITMYIDDNKEIAHNRMKELIDEGKPVMAVVDLYYMFYHKAYNKERGLHAVVVTGYDDENGIVELFDKYKLAESDFDGELSLAEFVEARVSDVPRENMMVGEYRRPIRNLWMEMNVDPEFRVTNEKIFNLIRESCSRMLGERTLLGQGSGLERLDAFRKDMLAKKEKAFDDRELFLFRNYYNTTLKRVARSRYRYRAFLEELGALLPEAVIAEVSAELTESGKRWDICANLFLKMAISKKTSLLDDIDKHLSAIIEIESKIIDRLGHCVQSPVMQ
jgi:hypothetical protein